MRTVLGQANVNAPKGSFDGTRQSMTIGSNDQIFSADAYKPIIVAYRNGAPVRLGDIGTVIDSVENDQLAAWVADGRNGYKPAVLLDIQRQPGANIIQTVDRIKALLPQLTATIPPSVKVSVLTDRTETIRASVEDVQFTLLLTVALVVMVIFVFLRKLWATVIPSVALPLSIIGTFGMMKLGGFSLDNLSLMALTISTGFVVDDAIVMIENIVRFIEAGDPPFEAALKGAQADRVHGDFAERVADRGVHPAAVHDGHRGPAVPRVRHHAQRGGGRLGGHFADADADDVRQAPQARGEGRCHRQGQAATTGSTAATEKFFDGMLACYESGLKWVLEHQFFTLLVAVATLVGTIWLYILIPKGLLPQQDTGVIIGVTDAAQNISFQAMLERQRAVADIVRQDPDVQSVGVVRRARARSTRRSTPGG